MRKTKIVVTLGPATESREMIERLIVLGVNVFRLNFSHGDHDSHRRLIHLIRAIAARLDIPVAILQDISGPKIRVGEIEGIMLLDPGDRLKIFPETTKGGLREITINHPEIIPSLKRGDHIFFADGTIQTEVLSTETDRVIVKVLVGGKLTSRKGVNLPNAHLPIDSLTAKDRADIAFGISEDVDYIALSFIRSPEDITKVKEMIAQAGGDIPIIAKIEMVEALEHLEEIMEVADGIMVARGDLGVELGVHKVPAVQKRIIALARKRGIPVITATQMLTSMMTSPYPTRAEVSDIANAVLDGTDAVMLSDETAVGRFPEAAVAMLLATINETEKNAASPQTNCHGQNCQAAAIAAAATGLAQCTGADGLISFTYSGASTRLVAMHRPEARLIATTSNSRTYRRLSLVRGVEPFFVEFSHANSDAAISLFVKQARRADFIRMDEVFVVIIGHHSNQSGSINQIQILDQESFERLQSMLNR